MAGRTRLWGRLSLTTAVIASLFVAAGPGHEAGATYPGANGRILFASASHGGFWTVAPDGTGRPRQLSGQAGDFQHFSPNGTRIALRRSSGEVWVMKADGTNQRQLPADAPGCDGVYGTTWSPDGTKIAFAKQCGSLFHIFLTNVNGSGQATQLTTFDASYPAWSPDGEKIAFTASTKIWVMNADGTNPVQLTPDYENSDVEWAPNSTRLIFSRRGPGDTGRRVYVMNRDGTGLTPVTPNDGLTDFEPVFSPDGTRIAFVEGEHLKIMDADGSNVTEIAPVIDGITMRASYPDWGISVAETVACSPPHATTRVSVASDGTQGSTSFKPAISADGRFVAFTSFATNLVAGDTNDVRDVFVRDRSTGATTRVSVASNGFQGLAHSGLGSAISADGRFVAFTSLATNLVAGDTNGFQDVFVHDRSTGVTTRVSVASDGTQGSNSSDEPAISADGRFVAFSSSATNLVPGDTNGVLDVFVHDRSTGATTRVSVTTGGGEGNNHSYEPAISADGRFVAFSSSATNLVPGDTSGEDVFVHNRSSVATTRVSVASDGTQGSSSSNDPAISADGRFVAFRSLATNLVAGDTNGVLDVFVHDRSSGATTRVSVASDGTQGSNSSLGLAHSFRSAISADGRFVAFTSLATNLVAGDTNAAADVFVHDRSTGATTRVSVTTGGGEGSNSSGEPAISADGRFVAFTSLATNLVAGDTNGSQDVFVGVQIFRPDAQIKTSRRYAGNDVYNRTGAGQNYSLSIAPGERAVFTIAVQHDGNTTDSYRLKGPGAQPGFTATYRSGRREVTKQVVAGTFTLARLQPCAAETIELVVTAKANAKSGTTKSWLITATSASSAGAKDAVKATVKVKS